MKNMNQAQRLTFVNITVLSIVGISLTGFDQVHWSIYIVPAALIFAAVSGYCVGFEISKRILTHFGKNTDALKAKSI